jgi:hypothetical protein
VECWQLEVLQHSACSVIVRASAIIQSLLCVALLLMLLLVVVAASTNSGFSANSSCCSFKLRNRLVDRAERLYELQERQ